MQPAKKTYPDSYRYLTKAVFTLGRTMISLITNETSIAVFTLDRNMISLRITNETCFVVKGVHIRQCIARIMIWLKHDYSEHY